MSSVVQAFVEGSANREGIASLMMGVKKLLAGAGAVAMFTTAAVIGLSAPAQAAGQTVTVTPNSNLKGGQVVTVTYSGFSPSAPIAVGALGEKPEYVTVTTCPPLRLLFGVTVTV